MKFDIRLIAVSVLSVLLWELLKYALRHVLSIHYYRLSAPPTAEDEEATILKVKVWPWDTAGRKHFEEQGYTRTMPTLPGDQDKKSK